MSDQNTPALLSSSDIDQLRAFLPECEKIRNSQGVDMSTERLALGLWLPRIVATLDAETARADAAETHNEGLRGQIAELHQLRAQEEMERRQLVDRADAAEEREKALEAWQCAECGARFDNTIAPQKLEGVTRCSSCVEKEVLQARIAQLESERPLLVETAARMQRKADLKWMVSSVYRKEPETVTLAQVEAEMKEGEPP